MKKFAIISIEGQVKQHVAYTFATNEEQARIAYTEFLESEGYAMAKNESFEVIELNPDAPRI